MKFALDKLQLTASLLGFGLELGPFSVDLAHYATASYCTALQGLHTHQDHGK